MANVLAARAAYMAARDEVARARIALGAAIAEARGRNVPQGKIAAELDLSREQIRRFQAEYIESLDAAEAQPSSDD